MGMRGGFTRLAEYVILRGGFFSIPEQEVY